MDLSCSFLSHYQERLLQSIPHFCNTLIPSHPFTSTSKRTELAFELSSSTLNQVSPETSYLQR